MDDLLLVPPRNVQASEKCQDVKKYLKENPDVKRLVSHSLASAVVNQINNDMPDRFTSTTYATPTIKPRRKGTQNPRRLDYRSPSDVVSMLDGYAETSNLKELNPKKWLHQFCSYAGLWHLHPTTKIRLMVFILMNPLDCNLLLND